MAKISDIRAQSADQLTEQLATLKKEQFNLRFQRAAGETGSLGRAKQVRRDIARIKTVQGEAKRGVVFAPKPIAAPKAKAATAVEAKPVKATRTKAAKPQTEAQANIEGTK